MDFTQSTVEEIVMEESFQRWALGCRDAEARFWDEWKAVHPEKKHTIEEAYNIIQAFQPQEIQIEQSQIDNDYAKISRFFDELNNHEEEPKRKVLQINKKLKVAAAFLIILIGSFTINLIFSPFNQSNEFLTETKEQKEIQLPDGSNVILNENTRLTFNKNWEKEKLRKVMLSGEAYFNVSEKTIDERPVKFIVESGNIEVEVIGTEFNINNQGEHTTVVLNSGKIKLTANNKTINMEPGDIAQYSPKKDRLIKKINNPEQYTSWVKQYKGSSRDRTDINSENQTRTRGGQQENKDNFASNRQKSENTKDQDLARTVQQNNYSLEKAPTGVYNSQPATEKSLSNNQGATDNPVNPGIVSTMPRQNYYFLPAEKQSVEKHENQSFIRQEGNHNHAYIEQIGKGLHSEQVQTGDENTAISEFSGSNEQTKSDDFEWSTQQTQEGARNVSIFHIVESYNTNIYSTQEGVENEINASVVGEENLLIMLQEGEYNIISAKQEGMNNEAGYSPLDPGILQQGQYNEAEIMQHGEYNRLNVKQQGNNNKSSINQQNK